MSKTIDGGTKVRLIIIIEKDNSEGEMWMPSIVESLQEYIDMVEIGRAGRHDNEVLNCKNGNSLSFRFTDTYFSEQIPYAPPQLCRK